MHIFRRVYKIRNLVTPRYIEVLCPNVSSAAVCSCCLLIEDSVHFPHLQRERMGSEVLDCESVLIESDRIFTLPLFPPLSLLLFE